jgi:hypothetical protein
MALLFIHYNLYYSCEIHYADGTCFSRIFTGTPQRARESALTFFLETMLDDDASNESFLQVSLHHLKTGEKIMVTSTELLRRPHEGLQREVELWDREGIKAQKVRYSFRSPQTITLLPVASHATDLQGGEDILGLADDWVITFGRKKTQFFKAV